MPKVDDVPRYVHVANALTQAIAKGRYPIGSTLPTEHELCETFRISRFTVREALRQLRDAGLVTRKPRAGTTVVATRHRMPYAQALRSIEDLLQYAADTELRLTHIGKLQIGPTIAREITIPPGEVWLLAVGIRYNKGDELPICVSRVYINPTFSDILRSLKDRPEAIYRLIEKRYGVSVARVEQRIRAVTLGRKEALQLKAEPNSPALRTLRLYYDAGGRLLEVSDSVHPADRFSYTMTIDKSA